MMMPIRRRFVPLLAAPLLLAAFHGAAWGASQERVPETRLVQLVLLEGRMGGGEDTGPLPENVRPALEDVQQLLPFQSYRLLDVALVRSNRRANTTMRGPNDAEYAVTANFEQETADRRLNVFRFAVHKLTSYGPVPAPPSQGQENPGPAVAPTVQASEVISTSFTAEVGKTVVVGTSRLNGGEQALIVLFTAVE